MKRVNIDKALLEAERWKDTGHNFATIKKANLIFSGLIFRELMEGGNGIDRYYDAFIVKHHAETLDDLYRICHKNGCNEETEVMFWYDDKSDRYLVEEA